MFSIDIFRGTAFDLTIGPVDGAEVPQTITGGWYQVRDVASDTVLVAQTNLPTGATTAVLPMTEAINEMVDDDNTAETREVLVHAEYAGGAVTNVYQYRVKNPRGWPEITP